MAKRMILDQAVEEQNQRLRKKSRAVTDFDRRLWTLLEDMLETMEAKNGVGIAAPQVGILRRAVIVDVGDGPVELINPVLERQEGDQYGYEGCLSVPGEFGMVHRPRWIIVSAQDRHGKPITIEAEDFFARAICHELDHLEGVLFVDVTDKMLTEDELDALIRREEKEEAKAARRRTKAQTTEKAG